MLNYVDVYDSSVAWPKDSLFKLLFFKEIAKQYCGVLSNQAIDLESIDFLFVHKNENRFNSL